MKRYYFFRTAYIGGQGRLKLFALPGQQTMVRYNQNEPLRTDVCVQTSREDVHRMIRFPQGTVFGAAVEGRFASDCGLRLHTHGDERYYRIDSLFPLAPARDTAQHREHLQETASSLNLNVPDDLRQAYAAFAGTAAPAQDNPLTRLTSDEMQLIEEHLNARGDLSCQGIYDRILGISRVRDRMALGICRFRFMKQNGDERTAYGTRSREIISRIPDAETSQEQTGTQREASGGYFRYFDIQRKAWRQFCTENFMDVDTQYLETDATAVPALQ